MRLGLYGGSFDPIHRGHLQPVREAADQLGLDRVLYLPTARPPHKAGQELVSAFARFAMVEIALLDEPRLAVSPYELVEGVAYTVDTLEHFRAELPEAELYLLIGSDSFADLTSWRRWRDLPGLARIAVLMRPGWLGDALWSALPDALRRLAESERVVFVDNEPIAASASDLRAALARGESPTGDLPAAVLQYIRKYDLYR